MSSFRSHLRRHALGPAWIRSGTGRVILLLGVSAGAFLTLELTGAINETTAVTGSRVVALAMLTLALVTLFPLLRREANRGALRRSWWLLAFTCACAGFGMATAVMATVLGSDNMGRVQQLEIGCGLATLLLTLLAVRLLPAEPLERRRRVQLALDLATLLLGAFPAFWVYAVHPAFIGPEFIWSRAATAGVYTVLSLLLLCALLLQIFQRHEGATRAGMGALVSAGVVAIFTLMPPICQLVTDDGRIAGSTATGWMMFAACLTLSARGMRASEASAVEEVPTTHFGVSFASAGLIAFLLFTVVVTPQMWEEHATLLLPMLFVAVALIVVRQTLIARENVRMAHAMQQAKEAAESANLSRLHFLANISHDLRTPLNGVLGCAQILLRDPTLGPKQHDLLKTMQNCGEHLRNLINDLLDLSKLEADRLELVPGPCDLKNFLEALIKAFALEAETKGIALELEVDASLPDWIMADRKRLHQILGNLVHNAVKFTEHGGVRVRVRSADHRLVWEVQDTGCGILPDKLGELFQPFHLVDERSLKLEGTGLGLSIAQKLARRMGGDITVKSIISKGSTFTLTMPYEEARPLVELKRTIVDYHGRRRRILIVDDQPANRIILRALLEPLDFLVEEAGDVAQAIEQIRFACPDIVLIDLIMPGQDGFELMRQIRAIDTTGSIPCFAVAAMIDDDTRARIAAAGFREVLRKPVSFELLAEAFHAHAAVEWTYGILEPAPTRAEPNAAASASDEIIPPPPEELKAFIDLARRGYIRHLETRARQLAEQRPECKGFARRVERHTKNFKVKELSEWLASLAPEPAHGPA